MILFVLSVAGIVLAQADGGHDFTVNAALDAGPTIDAGGAYVGAAVTFTDTIYGTCPVAPPVQVLDGGWKLLSPERAARTACLMEICDTDRMRRAKEQAAEPAPWWWVSLVGSVVSTAILTYGAVKAAGE